MKHSMIGRLVLCATAALVWHGAITTTANASDALLNKLVEKGVLNQREANEIRAELSEEQAQAVEMYNKVKVPSWIDEMKWSGDFRLRTEFFDNDDKVSNQNDRWRFRIRLRLGVDWKFHEWVTMHVRVASGDDDPVSTNQTLNDSFDSKTIRLDKAYVDIQPPGWDWVVVKAGKMKNPIWQPKLGSPMQYDGDVTPEGVAEVFTMTLGDEKRHTLFANLGQFVIDEFSGDENDPFLFDFQGGIQSAWGGEKAKEAPLKTSLAVGFMITHNADNYVAGTDSGNTGNAVSLPSGVYLDDLEVLNVRGDLAWQVCDKPFLGTPAVVTVAGEYITNLADGYDNAAAVAPLGGDNDQTEGYTAQVVFGQAKKKGTWQVGYQYKYLEADATWDAITDSDWGNGGTDRKGHVIKAAYQLQDWWQLGFAAFITEKISDRTNDVGNNTSALSGKELLRVQIDSAFKF